MKNKKNKVVLNKYTQPVYTPNDLYVCKNYTKSYIDKYFEFPDGCSIIPENEDTYLATTCYGVKHKTTNRLCIVVLLHSTFIDNMKKDIVEPHNTCAHEAFHVADEILRYSGVTLDESSKESYAYMVGWAAGCIIKTILDVK